MTGSFTLLLPMLGSCFAAMAVPTLLGDPPIYDSLEKRDMKETTSSREQRPLKSARPGAPRSCPRT